MSTPVTMSTPSSSSSTITSTITKKRKLDVRTIQEKYEAIQAVAQGKKKVQVARELGIPSNTLSTWLKSKDKIVQAYESSSFGPATKRMRTADFPDVEKALDIWFKDARSGSASITGPILRERALAFAAQLGHTDFGCSVGWLTRFKQRHGYQWKVICGEAHAAPAASIAEWKSGMLKTILTTYAPDDIFNCDETGLFFRMQPKRSYVGKGEDCHGGKSSKERITIMPCANMSGTEKMPLLVLGKFKKPRCFKGVTVLPTEYKNQRRAWMTGDLFTNWLMKLDSKFKIQKRKIAMVLDNCSAHPHVTGLQAIKLFFPPQHHLSDPAHGSRDHPELQGQLQTPSHHQSNISMNSWRLRALCKMFQVLPSSRRPSKIFLSNVCNVCNVCNV